MLLRTADGAGIEVADDLILRAAATIYARRRRSFGGPPKKPFRCCWCDAELLGRAALVEHERACAENSYAELVTGL